MSAPSHRAPGTGETSQQRHSYVPRCHEQTLLYTTLAAHLETFLAQREDRPLPRFVTRELRAFLECGILAHGFLRVRCPACREERLVPFSCKGRGFCPSCGGRRMADTAAWLVDRVLPEVPVRQWVLTLPFALRYRLAFDAELITVVLTEFMRAVFSSLRRRARHELGVAKPRCGAVTFVQRFGDALNLNIHFHSVVLDGVYEDRGDDQPRFHPLPPPDDREIALIAARIARRIAHRFKQRGLGPDDESCSTDPLAEEESWLAALAAASVQGRIAIGPQAGQRLLKLRDRVDPEDLPARSQPLCANIAGLGLHAGVALPARDRQRLERLCRYVARPAIGASRLSALDDGRLLYQLKKRWRDGTTHLVFEPLEFIAKLAALVPAPRVHLVRYHGVLAPGAPGRERIVPQPEDAEVAPAPCAQKHSSANAPTSKAASSSQTNLAATNSANQRYSWAALMRRVFAIDALECPRCQGPMKILAQIHPPDTTRKILQCLGLPARPPPIAMARPDPQESLPFDSDETAPLD